MPKKSSYHKLKDKVKELESDISLLIENKKDSKTFAVKMKYQIKRDIERQMWMGGISEVIYIDSKDIIA